MGENHDLINELAEELAYNYFANSFGDLLKEKIWTDEIFNQGRQTTRKDMEGYSIGKAFEARRKRETYSCRNILVVGAGASSDAYGCIPTGAELIKEFEERYVSKIRSIDFLRDRLEQEINDLRRLNRLNESEALSFENYLSLLSTNFVRQEDLRASISEVTGFRHAPSLFYELVAHLLKHGFLDVVINFNFEETLDQAIEEEIGKGNYHHILSDGHCVQVEDLLVDGRIKVPIYIKPHGSYSHKASLRFTNRHYLDLPNDIRQMLISLLSGNRGAGRPKIEQINLICVGFKLESMEFNEILNDYLPPYSRIYNISRSKTDDKAKRMFFEQQLPKFFDRASIKGVFNQELEKLYSEWKLDKKDPLKDSESFQEAVIKRQHDQVYKSIYTKIEDSNRSIDVRSLGNLFSEIWRQVYDLFKPGYRPRSIGRHELVSYLLCDNKFRSIPKDLSLVARQKARVDLRKRYDKSPDYFKDRVMIEIALALIRGNGIVDIVELLTNRVGRNYQLYRKTYALSEQNNEQTDKQITEFSLLQLLHEFTQTGEEISFPVSKQIELNSDEEFSYSRNVFKIDVSHGKPDEESVRQKLGQTWLKINVDKKSEAVKSSSLSVLGSAFVDEFIDLLSDDDVPVLTSIILFRLFSSDKLSRSFKINLLETFNEKVSPGKRANSRINDKDKGRFVSLNDRSTLLTEVFRLFAKSEKKHYFIINSNPNNPKHQLWESFNKRRILHTNLSVNYEFRNIFQRKGWDLLLSVSETGDLLRFIRDRFGSADQTETVPNWVEELREGKRRLILICSYEAVSASHPGYEGKDLINVHRKYLFGTNDGQMIWKEEAVDILLMPYWQHNHHINAFLKSVDPQVRNQYWQDDTSTEAVYPDHIRLLNNSLDQLITFGFVIKGSFYIYRRGFSSRIDPIILGDDPHIPQKDFNQHDQSKILLLFYTYVCRALAYEEAYFDGVEHEDRWSSNGHLFRDILDKGYHLNVEADVKLEKKMQAFFQKVYVLINSTDMRY